MGTKPAETYLFRYVLNMHEVGPATQDPPKFMSSDILSLNKTDRLYAFRQNLTRCEYGGVVQDRGEGIHSLHGSKGSSPLATHS